MSTEELLVDAAVILVFLGVAFPIHEFAHALAAYRLGDGTAKLMGRLTLDPRAHFDPAGGIILAISVLVSPFAFGWAKPTPVNPRNLRGGRWGEAIVSAAGPASNLVLAIAAAIPLRYIVATGMDAGLFASFLALFVYINLLLMVFNFIPVPPLDGSKVLFAFMNPRTAWQLRPILDQYGFFILLILIIPLFGGASVLGTVIGAIIDPLFALLTGL